VVFPFGVEIVVLHSGEGYHSEGHSGRPEGNLGTPGAKSESLRNARRNPKATLDFDDIRLEFEGNLEFRR